MLLPKRSAARRASCDELLWLGFGQLEPGVLAHATLTVSEHGRLRGLRDGDRATYSPRVPRIRRPTGESPPAAGSPRALAASVPAVHRRVSNRCATHWMAHRRSMPESAFVVRTLLLHEFRKVHLRDPLLPAPLLPADWAGFAAYDLCRDLYARVFQTAEAHLAVHARRLRGPMPPIEPATYARFGGLARAAQSSSVQ